MHGPVGGFVELTLETHDLETMAEFYERRLGLDRISEDDDRIWLRAGPEARLGLWSPGEKEHGDEGGHAHFAFAVDAGALPALADRLGGEVTEHEGGDLSLYVEDPAGNSWSSGTTTTDASPPSGRPERAWPQRCAHARAHRAAPWR